MADRYIPSPLRRTPSLQRGLIILWSCAGLMIFASPPEADPRLPSWFVNGGQALSAEDVPSQALACAMRPARQTRRSGGEGSRPARTTDSKFSPVRSGGGVCVLLVRIRPFSRNISHSLFHGSIKALRRILIILAAHLAILSCALSQRVDIRGVVADSVTGERIPFANVLLLNTNKGAATNINGFYLLPSVAPGTYEVSASSIGYRRKVLRIIVESGRPVTLNFRLPQEAVELQEVLVTGVTRRELSEISTSVHVLEQRDLKLVPAAVQADVFRSIQILPGITSTNDVSAQFYVRGGAGDQNLILFDGIRVYNPYHAFGLFSMFDSDIINTTEVYTGAFPPGYGGRLSSVVSLITRDGTKAGIAGSGNINFLSSKFLLEGPMLERGQWLVNVRKSLFSSTLHKFFRKDVPLSFYDVFLKASMEGDSSANAKLGVEAFLSGDEMTSSEVNQPNYSWRNVAVGLNGSALIQDRIFVYATLGLSSFEAKRDPKRSTVTTPASTSVSELSLRTNATYYTDSRDLYFFGFDFSFPALEYKLVNILGQSTRLANTLPEVSAWARYQTSVADIKADLGFHVEIGSLLAGRTGWWGVQPRVHLSYEIAPLWRAKVSYGRFTQNLIAVNNEDDLTPIFDAWIAVPDDLEPERSDHYVLGLEGNLLPNLSLNLQTYYKLYGSLVTYNRDKVDARDPDYINSTGESYGGEALVRFGTSTVDLYAAYTLAWTTITQNDFTYYPRYDRRHTLKLLSVVRLFSQLTATARWDFGTGFPFTQSVGYYDRLSFSDFYDSAFQDDTGSPYTRLGSKNSKRMPTYHRLDANLDYHFTMGSMRASVGIHLINVYNQRNVLYFDRQTGQQIDMLPFFPSATLSLEY